MNSPTSSGNLPTSPTDSGQTPPADMPLPDAVRGHQSFCLGMYFVGLSAITFYLLVDTWPVSDNSSPTGFASFSIFGFGQLSPHADQRFMLTVIIAGALGSLIHSATSFADYVGNRSLTRSWIWWLVLRTPVGIALALLFYLVLRGGLIVPSLPGSAGQTNTTNLLNPYGIAAISALAGMFSKQATDKLREIFDTLFRTREPVGRADPLNRAKPTISSIEPAKLAVGGPIVLNVLGQSFHRDCTASVNGTLRQVEWQSPMRLTVTLLPEDVARKTELTLVIRNPGPVGGETEALRVVVE